MTSRRVILVSFIILRFLYLDVDECTVRSHNCHPMATCTDTIGSFTCQCQNGYTGNGQTCTGKNETFTEYMCSAKQKVP